MLAHPMTFLSWEVVSADGRPHQVQLYYDNQAELVVNKPDQQVAWGRQTIGDMTVLRMGSQAAGVGEEGGRPADRLGLSLRRVAQRGNAAGGGGLGRRGPRSLPGRAAAAHGRRRSDAPRPRTPRRDRLRVGRARGGQDHRHAAPAAGLRRDQSIEYLPPAASSLLAAEGGAASDLFEAAEPRLRALRRPLPAFDEYLMADLKKPAAEVRRDLCPVLSSSLAANGLAADSRACR